MKFMDQIAKTTIYRALQLSKINSLILDQVLDLKV
ncbi:MAG: hypothetical protein K0S53_1173 [Bacteroidetes bacterium]|jgi:hypothetical protein|nr:hypothetical protein [Bacteroidota bacterium]